jgi:hypothetical protein
MNNFNWNINGLSQASQGSPVNRALDYGSMTLNLMTFSITTLSIMTLCMMTLSRTIKETRLSSVACTINIYDRRFYNRTDIGLYYNTLETIVTDDPSLS